MFDARYSQGARLMRWLNPTWRLSTWWPSDTLNAVQQSLLRLLSLAHRERMEVAPLVANLADEHRFRHRYRLRQLARRLADGTPLVDALEQTPDALRDEDVLSLRFARQSGTLGPTYEWLLSESNAGNDRSATIRRQSSIYWLVTIVVLLFAFSFLIVYIFPALRQIHENLGLSEAGPFYDTFLGLTGWVSRHGILLVLAALTLAFLSWSAPSRRFFRRTVSDRWGRGVAQCRSGQLCHMLSTAVEAGRPMPAAISTLARYHFDRNVRQQLLFARNEMEQGSNVWTSLADARLITPGESKAVAQSSSPEVRAWTLREFANLKLRHVSRRNENRLRFLQPALTILLAAVVLLAAGAMFGYLAELIQSLARIV